MAKESKRVSVVITSVLMMVFLSGCGENVESVAELAGELEKEGIRYTKTERIGTGGFKHAKIEEALSLKGEELDLEVYRIEDRRTYKTFAGSVLLLAAAEKKIGEKLPERPQLYSKRPFVIVVRKEPEKGEVQKALENIFDELE